MFNNDIGIDLGTATVLVYIKGKGIVLKEPSVVAVNTKTNTVCAVGEEAHKMLGRTPPFIQAVRPLNDGVISNYTLTEAMVKTFIKKASAKTMGHPRIMMCVPSGITDVEQRAVIETAREAGAKEIYIIEEPVAAAVGAGAKIYLPHGTMVIDIGGGTTDIAVISLGNIVVSRSVKLAGDKLDEAIVRYMKKKYNMNIGPRTAEYIKINAGGVLERPEPVTVAARGINILSGLPEKIMVTSTELVPIFDDFVFNIVERIREVFDETPPELHGDIGDDGIILTGGGALIYGLAERITSELGIKTILASDVVSCVARGAGMALENIDLVNQPTKMYFKRAYIRQ